MLITPKLKEFDYIESYEDVLNTKLNLDKLDYLDYWDNAKKSHLEYLQDLQKQEDTKVKSFFEALKRSQYEYLNEEEQPDPNYTIQDYVQLSKDYHAKQKIFIEKMLVLHKKSGSIKHLKYDEIKIAKDNYINIVMRSDALQQKNKDKIALFVTLTLPTEYHKYKHNFNKKSNEYEATTNKHGNLIKNDKYKEECTIHKGYRKLLKIFRKMQKNFYDKQTDKQITFDNMRVIEYHGDFTPHLHGIIFIDSEHIEAYLKQVKKFFGNTVKAETETKITYIKNEHIGRSEIEILQDSTKVTGYLSKYIKKSIKPDNEDNFYLLDGWRKTHKIRIFQSSRVSLPRYIYKKLYQWLGNTISILNDNDDNINPLIKRPFKYVNKLLELEKIVNLNITTHDTYTGSKDTQTVQKDTALYDITIRRTKSTLISDFNDNTLVRYKVDSFVITNILTDSVVYDSNDYQHFEDYETYAHYLGIDTDNEIIEPFFEHFNPI